MADVTLQVRINGGAVQTGAVTAATGNTCQLTAADKSGWSASAVQWQIYSYPPAFTVPAGWTADADGIFYVNGSADPPVFTMDEWGKYLTRVVAANQSPDERTAVSIPSPGGLVDVMRREGAQFGGERLQYVADMQDNLRVIEAGLGGGSGTVAPDPDEMLLRGPAGEGKVTSLETDEVVSSVAGALILGRAGHTGVNILADTVTVEADEVVLQDAAGSNRINIDLGAAGSVTLRDDLTSFAVGWVASGAGAGAATTVRGQQGAAGSIGGTLTLGGGDGGTPGTNLAGATTVAVGAPVANVSAKFAVDANGTELLKVFQSAASTTRIEKTTGNLEIKGFSDLALKCDVAININPTGALYLNSPNSVSVIGSSTWTDAPGFSTVLTRTMASNYVENFVGQCDRQVGGASRHLVDANGTRLTGNVRHASAISPAAIGANQTDYVPAGLLTAQRLRQDVSAACEIISMAAGSDGQRITIENISGTGANTLTLRHDDGANGTAAQRFLCANNASVIIRGNGAVTVEYDGTSSRWRVLSN